MEKYLITDYKMIENIEYLKTEKDIEDYFKNCYGDYLPCGQGYYTDKAKVYCKIDEKYYLVYINGDVCSSRQEYGDNLYWIESIDIDYEEIEKPIPKIRNKYSFSMNLLEKEFNKVCELLDKNNIEYVIENK